VEVSCTLLYIYFTYTFQNNHKIGSSNALLATLAEESGEKITPECSAFVIIKGQTRAIDVIEFEKRNNNTPIYSFLTLTWGYIADVDTGSD
jgi:diacylglycerol kinase family enzyme